MKAMQETLNLTSFKLLDEGGHFAACEVPEVSFSLNGWSDR